ncbi:MAG: type II secretion system protein J, partial [Planctomycetota bacterium JB042]
MLPTRPPRPRGFSVAEMCVVVALSAILALGLSALIDVPRELAVRHDGTNVARLSAADRVIRQLDDDVRFAKDVRTPGPGELVVVRADGETVRYRWEGVGRALSRSAPEGSGELLEQVTRVGFAIGWTEVDAGYEEGGLVSSPVAVARFSGFAALLGIAARLGRAPVDGAHAVGLYFRAAGLGEESGLVSEARVRLRRAGDEGLRVRLLRADPGSRQPIVGTELAGGVVASSALPLATTDVALPLTATKAVREGD